MMFELVSNFEYWPRIFESDDFLTDSPLPAPEKPLFMVVSEKEWQSFLRTVSKAITKCPDDRLSVAKILDLPIFNIRTTVDEEERKDKMAAEIKQQMMTIQNTISSLQHSLENFLPAIRHNIQKLLALEGDIPNWFVMIPEKSSSAFIDGAKKVFYQKYTLYFICEEDGKLMKDKDLGYSMFDVTKFGKAALVVSKCLVSAALKQFAGISTDLTLGGSIGTELISQFTTLTDQAFSTWEPQEFNDFTEKSSRDYNNMCSPLLSSLKDFLKQNGFERTGLVKDQTSFGEVKWKCESCKVNAKFNERINQLQ
jgi:hypothetical protein